MRSPDMRGCGALADLRGMDSRRRCAFAMLGAAMSQILSIVEDKRRRGAGVSVRLARATKPFVRSCTHAQFAICAICHVHNLPCMRIYHVAHLCMGAQWEPWEVAMSRVIGVGDQSNDQLPF